MVSLSEFRDAPPWLPDYFVGGHPALDFLNTVPDRSDPSVMIDRFDNLEKVAGWCEFCGLLDADAAQAIRCDRAFLHAESATIACLLEMRAQAGRIFDCLADQKDIPARDLAAILATAGTTVASLDLSSKSGPPGLCKPFRPATPNHLVGMLSLLVLEAIYTLPHDRIRACPNCRWLFCDTSRGGRRKWCSMQDCGNRDKVRRHYRRHRRVV